jgi:hypothetical protein
VTATSPEVRSPVAGGLTSAGLSFIFLAGAIMLLGATLATTDRPTVAVVWGGLALAAYAAGLVCLACAARHAGISLARWKVGLWLLIWYGIVFGIATVTWSQPQTGVSSAIALTSVIRALWLVAVGMTAWVVGYLIGPGQVVRSSLATAMGKLGERFTTQVRSPIAPWLVYAIGLAARLTSTALSGRFGYVGDPSAAVSSATSYAGVLGALSLFGPLAVAAAALQVFREGVPGSRITLAILFLVELVFGAAAGGKLSFVITVLAVVIPYATVRRRVPGIALIALIAVFFLVVIPFNQAYRASARQGSVTLSPRQAVATAPQILGQTLTGHSVAEIVPSSLGYLAQRIREIDSVAIIVQRTPNQVAFVSPLQLIEGPVVGMVPRVLWPGKPILITGYQFSQEYFGLPSNLYTSTADTMIGGLYWHGGWISMIVGMFLLGCAFRLLDEVLDMRRNPHAIFLVLLLLPSLVGGEEDWQAILTALPATVFVWLFAVALTFRMRRPA